ncbi:MAG: phage protease [Syntrophobacter sp.]
MRTDEDLKLGFFEKMPEEPSIPAEFQVFPSGLVEIEGAEPFLVDDPAMERAIERFRARGLDMVIDYEHQTEGGDRAPAAGWIKRLESRGNDGLWAIVEWTERARDYLARREYRYFSPVFLVSKERRELSELLRVALTNAPRLNWIKPIVAKSRPRAVCPHGAAMRGKQSTGGKGMEFLKMAAKQVGLPETAGAEEVLGEIGKLRKAEETVACKEVLAALDLPAGAGKSEAVATIHALRQKPDLTLEVAALKRRLSERERDDLVASALKEGKITPAQREWAERYALGDSEGFRLFVAKAPRVVPLDRIDQAGNCPSAHGPDRDQLEINKLLGISEETWKKYNPAA